MEFVNPPARSQILHQEMNRALSNLIAKGQAGFAELIIEVLGPILEAIGVEIRHVGHDDLAHEFTDGFTLFLAVGMQGTGSHILIFEQYRCRNGPALGRFVFSTFTFLHFNSSACRSLPNNTL